MLIRLATGIIVGGTIGFGWYKLVGCSTGACPLTSHPLVTVLYGSAVGALLAMSSH